MDISNSGKMRKVKAKIETALEKEEILNILEAVIVGREVTLDDINDLIKKSGNPDVSNNITIYDLTKEDVINNDFLNNVGIEDEVFGYAEYANKRIIRKDCLALYSEDRRDLDTYELHKEYFRPSKTVRLPLLRDIDSNVCWMSIEPHEIRTLNTFVQNAYGNVLICGCGLGYTTFMLSQKDNVGSITILERNEDIIKLFEHQILPKLGNKKINIIKCDANDYLNNEDLSKYDYINVDLWYDTFDMVYPYIKGLILETKYPNTHFTYWLEETFLVQIQAELLEYIVKGTFSNLYPSFSIIAEGIISISNDLITDEETLKKIISFESIKSSLIKWAYMNPDTLEQIALETIENEKQFVRSINDIKKLSLGFNPLHGNKKY